MWKLLRTKSFWGGLVLCLTPLAPAIGIPAEAALAIIGGIEAIFLRDGMRKAEDAANGGVQ